MRFILLLLLFIATEIKILAQNTDSNPESKDTTSVKNAFFGVPIIFYLPETRWGFGGAGFYDFRFKKELPTSNPSQVQFSINYTQNKQLIFAFPYEIYKNNNKWKFKGDAGFFKYQYYFYGLGNQTKLNDVETYKVDFLRIRSDFLQKYKDWYFGLRYRIDFFDVTQKREGGLLSQLELGKNGGFISGFGLLAQWDKRDFIYNPTKGHYLELEAFLNSRAFGSDFTYRRIGFDFAKYQRLADEHTFVFHTFFVHTTGGIPFFEMPYFGSPRLMRGVQDRRLIDRNVLVFQTEYRYPIWKAIQGVAFGSMGNVSNSINQIFDHKYLFAFGAGLRITVLKHDRTRLRVDYGRTLHEGGSFYLTINDAF